MNKEKFPTVSINDIFSYPIPLENDIIYSEGITYIYHEISENEICYVRIIFDVSRIDDKFAKYILLLRILCGELDTETMGHEKLSLQIDTYLGGLKAETNNYANYLDSSKIISTFEIKLKCFRNMIEKASEIVRDIFHFSKFDDYTRIIKLIEQNIFLLRTQFVSNLHDVALRRVISNCSEYGTKEEGFHGINSLELLERLKRDFINDPDCSREELLYVVKLLHNECGVMVDIIGNQIDFENVKKYIGVLFKASEKKIEFENKRNKEIFSYRREAMVVKSNDSCVAMAGNFSDYGLRYTGALRILNCIMNYEYLWNEIRIAGKAYGCKCNFGRIGIGSLLSMRDPSIGYTIKKFKDSIDFINGYNCGKEQIEKYKIAAIRELDFPLGVYARGTRSLSAYLCNLSFEDILLEREEIMKADIKTINSLAEYIEAIIQSENICVCAEINKIKRNSDYFDYVKNLTNL